MVLGYRRVNPIDGNEVYKSNGRSLNFLFHEPSVFLNPQRLFIDLDFHCINDAATGNNKSLLQSNYTSCLNPCGQGLVDSISINLGEALLTRFDQNYSLMARILYQTEYSKASKTSYLKDFEGYDSDAEEDYNADVKLSYNSETTTTDGTPTTTYTTPKNGCGRRAAMLTDKKTVTVRIQLFSCLSSFSGLIPNDVPIGLKIYLTSSKLVKHVYSRISMTAFSVRP